MKLSKEELMYFKNQLLTERIHLLTSKEKTQESLLYSQGNEPSSDEVDLMSLEQINRYILSIQRRGDLYLKKIESSLLSIEKGNYGICQECASDIDVKRLHARPTSTLCLQCKELEERNEEVYQSKKRRFVRVV